MASEVEVATVVEARRAAAVVAVAEVAGAAVVAGVAGEEEAKRPFTASGIWLSS